MIRPTFVLSLCVALVAACASPDLDRGASDFDYKTYHAHLNACRGGSAIEAAIETAGIGLWGSVVGAYHGLYLGLHAGEKAEGILVGALLGAGVGIGIGAV